MKLNKTQTRLQELDVEFHTYVDKYDGKPDTDTTVQYCGRCNGTGYLSHYMHIHGGICYDCEGHPERTYTYAELRKKDRDWVNRTNRTILKRVLDQQEADARLAKFNEEHPGVSEIVARLAKGENHFALSIERALEDKGTLTENQLNAILRMNEQQKAKATEKSLAEPVPAGKHTITGTILSTKWVENNFSYHGSGTLKMVVQDDRGFKVYGTVPNALTTREDGTYYSDLRNSRVTFTATLEPSQDDDKFGFYKRPTKAQLI